MHWARSNALSSAATRPAAKANMERLAGPRFSSDARERMSTNSLQWQDTGTFWARILRTAVPTLRSLPRSRSVSESSRWKAFTSNPTLLASLRAPPASPWAVGLCTAGPAALRGPSGPGAHVARITATEPVATATAAPAPTEGPGGPRSPEAGARCRTSSRRIGSRGSATGREPRCQPAFRRSSRSCSRQRALHCTALLRTSASMAVKMASSRLAHCQSGLSNLAPVTVSRAASDSSASGQLRVFKNSSAHSTRSLELSMLRTRR
mmetsp:Transcript_190/g.471  ORF Transcript_190/g.471 Transcript_190/m.471 type:complete len:265 (+) Transcript_190:380-1174(+)